MLKFKRLLLSPDPPEGSTPPPADNPPSDPPAPSDSPPGPPPPVATANPPPAAKIVVEGTKTEKELALERQLKETETRASQLEDENRRLKTPPTPRVAKEKADWLGLDSFFGS